MELGATVLRVNARVMARGHAFRVAYCAVLFLAALWRFSDSVRADENLNLGAESIRAAIALSRSGSFADPFASMPTGPTSHLSPAFPYVAASTIRMFGETPLANRVLALLAVAATALVVALLPLLSCMLGMGEMAGVVGAIAALVMPLETYPAWETSYATLLVVAVTLLTFRWYATPEARPGPARWLLIGLAWGLCIFVQPVALLPFLTFIGIRALWRWPIQPGMLREAALVSLTALLVLLPWTARNYAAFDRFIFVRGNLGLELAVSHNDCAQMGLQQNTRSGCFRRFHPNWNAQQANLVARHGESLYYSERLHDALAWMQQHPARALSLTLQRAWFFWFPSDAGNYLLEFTTRGSRRYSLVMYAMTLSSILGLALLLRQRRVAALMLSVWLLTYPPIYYLLQFESRYRYPVLWITLLLGGYAITWLFARGWQSSQAVSGSSSTARSDLVEPVQRPVRI